MKSLTSYLLVAFMVMFWVFRIVIAFTTSMQIDIGFIPMNMNIEIILLFVFIPCIILVIKRSLIGAVIYLVSYGAYFGVDLLNIVIGIMSGVTTLVEYTRAITSFIGVILPIAVVFNLLVDKARMAHPVDKKTDWFYNNKEFDRKLDSRADKNQYRNY